MSNLPYPTFAVNGESPASNSQTNLQANPQSTPIAEPPYHPDSVVTQAASECTNLEQVRGQIDRIDSALIDLLAQRFRFTNRAGALKSSTAQIVVPERMEAVIQKVRAKAEKCGLSPSFAEQIWRQMIDRAIANETQNHQS